MLRLGPKAALNRRWVDLPFDRQLCFPEIRGCSLLAARAGLYLLTADVTVYSHSGHSTRSFIPRSFLTRGDPRCRSRQWWMPPRTTKRTCPKTSAMKKVSLPPPHSIAIASAPFPNSTINVSLGVVNSGNTERDVGLVLGACVA